MKAVLADLGIGNLHSLRKGLEKSGATVEVTPDPRRWLDARVLVLPGVGAFAAGMRALDPVRDRLREKLTTGTPTLGVCLGLQLLFEGSDEAPGVRGLGVVSGTVRRFPHDRVAKVPHMGWARVHHADDPLFDGVRQDAYCYFVHSYYPDPLDDDVTLARTEYGVRFPSVVREGNVTAAQFHPEKSGDDGLRMLRNWVGMTEEVAA